jgi:hypothetical protein
MSFIGDAVGDIVGGITGAKQSAKAAGKAAATQAASAQAGINEQRRQFDALTELMAPYVEAGTGALGQQQALIGLGGPGAQRGAIAGFEQSPLFQALTQQGENAILQNASATGGLRGGNVQAALSQFRPQALNALIEQQYGRLGGLSELGQAAAAGQGSAGMESASNVGNLLANQGAAIAGGQVAKGGVVGQSFGNLLSLGTLAAGAFGGGGGAAVAQPGAGVISGGSGINFGGGGSGFKF